MSLRLYLRRSKGDEHQQFSLDVQRDGVQQFVPYLAEHFGVAVDWADRVEYVDDDRSRTDFDGREALLKLRRDVQEGDVVVCRDQSRVGGDALEVSIVVRELVQRRHARLFYYSKREEVAYQSVMDAVRTFVEGVGSQMEVENIRSRTREALRAKVKLGRLAGGKCYGYRNVRQDDGSGRRFTVAVVDEEQAEVVRHMFAAARMGRGFKSIASELNHAGHVTLRGGRWTDGAVRTVLTNARYRGVYIHGRVNRVRSGDRRIASRARPEEIMVVEMPQWRIVDDITWYAVQAQFQAREKGPQMTAPATKYALSGIARCAECGGAVGAAARTIVSEGGVRSRLPAYACIGHRTKGSCSVSVAQRIDEVDGAVADFLQAKVLTPAVVDQLMAGVREEVARQAGGPKANVKGMEKQLQRLQAEQRNLARAVAAGGDGIPALLDELRSRQRRIEELHVAIESARRAPAMVGDLMDKVEAAVRAKLA
ncbi:MAG: recombinase family protein, partial [Dehalococcoidia bacterium]|nr:recombinase family protein [Dehalococcoidia bacterium]